jgi:hypothetical protein
LESSGFVEQVRHHYPGIAWEINLRMPLSREATYVCVAVLRQITNNNRPWVLLKSVPRLFKAICPAACDN